MRLGVLDVGSNTVHLLLVDAHPGARPLPAYKHKVELRLAELLDDKGRITADGADRLVAFCVEAIEIAEDKGAEMMFAFATSALREAANGDKVIDNAPVEGCTGGALKSDVTAPGPIYLQGDHTAVEFRNVRLTPAK